MSMRTFASIVTFFGLTFAFLSFCSAPEAQRPPNIVIILSDDQGWGDLSVHGNTNLATPNIDSLARDGALFDRFYVSAKEILSRSRLR